MAKKSQTLTPRQMQTLKRLKESPEFFVRNVFRDEKTGTPCVEPTKQQLGVLRAIENGENRIAIRSGHGCFGLDTPVMMFDGSIRKVQEVKEGELLMGDDGTKRNVLELRRGREDMYEFEFMDGTKHEYNLSHILCLVATQTHGRQCTGDKVTVTVKEWLGWSERRRRTHAIYRKKSDIEPTWEGPSIPGYILGTWLGDGHSNGTVITNIDDEVISAWREHTSSLGMKERREGKNSITYCYSNNRDNELLRRLEEFGVRNNKHIPFCVFSCTEEYRMEVLAGILDTDGSLTTGGYEVIQKSKELSEGILRLARSVGCYATMRKCKKYCYYKGEKKEGEYYRIYISRNAHNIPVRIERKKYSPTVNQRKNLHIGIRKATSLGEGDYYGFVLDGNHKFLHEDHTVLHNTGKTALSSWLILWYLFANPDANVPCTASTAPQLSDILWKELNKWINKMSPAIKVYYEWSASHIRMVQDPNSCFAVARTARKENPEALQGFHSDHLFFLIDEASGVPEQIFEVAHGSLTGKNTLVMMTGNPTRLIGYFYDSFHKNKENWSTFHFSSEETSLVSDDSVKEIIDNYGRDSDEYRVRVLGDFPRADAVDDQGYVPLLLESDIVQVQETGFSGVRVLGVDPSGEGDDETVWVLRDNFKAKVVLREKVSSTKTIAQKTLSLMEYYNVKAEHVIIDNFGEGANVAQELAFSGKRVKGLNVGDKAGSTKFINKRAELYWGIKQWLRSGGELVTNDGWDELLNIRYRPELNGKLRIMSKKDMKKLGIKSPNVADALMLSLLIDTGREEVKSEDVQVRRRNWKNPAMSGVSARRSWGS